MHGEDAVIRILDKESISEQFTQLRLDILGSEAELNASADIAEPGMVLVTGPTGSGKTTTLYAALSEIKSIEDKIITIEDPVEYQLKGITQTDQREEGADVRAVCAHPAPRPRQDHGRRDPRQRNRADCDQFRADRPPVFTTVHANNVLDGSAASEHGVEAYQFVSALNCVLAQRLVRNICHHCKRPTGGAPAAREPGLDPALEHSHTFYEDGCIECGGTG